MDVYVGLDIGGTKLMVAAADAQGNLLRTVRADTPHGLSDGLNALKRMAREVAGDARILAIGAAAGGPLDWRSGVVSPLHQPEWREVPLKRIFEQEFECPFWVDVDTNVAALGEYRFGGNKARGMLYLTLSTGMGGGFLIDGKIYRGMDGAHPEAAHQSVPFRVAHPERVQCECGAPDCLEALVSGNAIRRIYGKPAEQLSAEQWTEVAYNLGLGLRNLAVLYAPDVIVLGGGVAVGGGEPFIRQAAQVMRDRMNLVPHPRVCLSHLGYDTALKGAIALAIAGEGALM